MPSGCLLLIYTTNTDLALGVGDAQRTLVHATQQSGHRKAVATDGLGRTLQVVDPLCAAVKQRGQLIRERHGNGAQAPGGGQAGGHAGVQQHGGHRVQESCQRRRKMCI